MIELYLVIFFLVWIVKSFGYLVLRNNNLSHLWDVPVGFVSLFLVLQIFYYPIQFLNLDSKYIHVSSTVVILLVLIYSIKDYKKILSSFFSEVWIWTLLSLFMFSFIYPKLSLDLGFSDAQMYLNYVSQNLHIDHVNLFNPWTGLEGTEFITVYLYQGYFLFASYLNFLVNFPVDYLHLGTYLDSITITTYGLGILYTIFTSHLVVLIVSSIRKLSIFLKNLLIFIALFYFNYYAWRITFSFYGNTWRTMILTLFLLSLYLWIIENRKIYQMIAAIAFGAALMVSSSALFIGFAMLMSVSVYRFINHELNIIEDTSLISIPMVVYVLAILQKDHLTLYMIVLPITILFYIHLIVKPKSSILRVIDAFISRNAVLLLFILLPLITILFSFVDMKLNPDYIWNMTHYFQNHQQYDMVKDYFFIYSNWVDNIFSLIRWTGVILILFSSSKDKRLNFLRLYFIFAFLFFLDPLSTSFVSKAFASNVYYRLYEVVFNPFTEIFLIVIVLEKIKAKKFIYYLSTMVIVISVLLSHYQSLFKANGNYLYGQYIDLDDEYDDYTKVGKLELPVIRELQKAISNNLLKHKQWTIISQIEGIRTFLPHIYIPFTPRQYYSAWDRIDQDFYLLARRYYGWDKSPLDLDYSQSCTYVKKYEIDYVVTERWENILFDTSLTPCTEIVYDNAKYRLLRVK